MVLSEGIWSVRPASKLSYLGEQSESRENVRASGIAASGQGKGTRSPTALPLTCALSQGLLCSPNRRACSQAIGQLTHGPL